MTYACEWCGRRTGEPHDWSKHPQPSLSRWLLVALATLLASACGSPEECWRHASGAQNIGPQWCLQACINDPYTLALNEETPNTCGDRVACVVVPPFERATVWAPNDYVIAEAWAPAYYLNPPTRTDTWIDCATGEEAP